MKKISIISICLLIFVVGIGCASAADYDVDVANNNEDSIVLTFTNNTAEFNGAIYAVANDTAIDDTAIDEANDNENSIVLTFTNNTAEFNGAIYANSTTPTVASSSNGGNGDSTPDSLDDKQIAGIVMNGLGVITLNPILIVISLPFIYDWW